MAKNYRRMARLHLYLGFALGLPVLFWTLSGFFFTLYPIEIVRGEHLRAEDPFGAGVPAGPLAISSVDAIDRSGVTPTAVTLRPFVDGPVWQVESAETVVLISAVTGQQLSPLDAGLARQVALYSYGGRGTFFRLIYVEAPPREAGVEKPMWRADFVGRDAASFWIDPDRGTVKAVRTGIWRAFDAMWRLHILDVTGADRIDSWWLRAFAFGAFVFSLTGLVLMGLRLWRRPRRAEAGARRADAAPLDRAA